jgi:RHS repeat-associated protein
VGGLLLVNSAANGVHFAAYDGNGNVVALLSVNSGQQTASYEYSAFGETLRATGSLAKENPYRFSTKPADDVTVDILWEYRRYRPDIGRWISRDAIAERGGVNLYAFCKNGPVSSYDALGNIPYVSPPGPCCCACVIGLKIDHVQKINQQHYPWEYGHRFNVIINLEYKHKKGSGDAQLLWEEKSDRPPPWYQVPPNTWVDLFYKFPDSLVFDGWRNRSTFCPSTQTITLDDRPISFLQLGSESDRTLDFRITVRSGFKCDCSLPFLTVTAKQILKASDAPPPGNLQQQTFP